jgi:ADP-ribosyltransferase exoenzyme
VWINGESVSALDARLRPRWRAWLEQLPEAEQDALRTYKSPRYLRFALARNQDRQLTAEDSARWAALDRAFLAARWPCDTLLWRGFRAWGEDDSPPGWELPKVGERRQFDFWTSTSLSELAAANEASLHQARDGDLSVLYEIELPAGHPAIYMEAIKDVPTGEAEVLLPRATSYVVTQVERFDSLRTVAPKAYKPFGPGCWRIQIRIDPKS